MNLYLIKLGKAWQVIKRDGVCRGLQRVFGALFSMFRTVGRGDILFISGGIGDSALYRTVHVAEELRLNGFRCSVTIQDNPFLSSYVDKFSVFVFHRTLYTEKVKKMIDAIKAQDKVIIFDTDDLVYDPKYLSLMDYYQKMNSLEKKLYQNGLGGEILRDQYVKVATTTTSFLAEKLRAEGKEVFIVPNKLSVKDVRDAEKVCKIPDHLPAVHMHTHALQAGVRNDKGIIRLGYFSGTISHNKDFATITDALMRIMEKYPHVELLLVGPLDVESILVQKFRERIVQLPYALRAQHFANVAKCDINLAPLEKDNPFCEAKSELKFFEAGIVFVPTVAVANRTFAEAVQDGVDGFVAHGTDEWVEKLSQLIENKKMRKNMGERAHRTAVERHTTQNAKNLQYYEYLRERIGK
ncbi:MAG: glycosyltransferase [Parcubacteria group bacterium]